MLRKKDVRHNRPKLFKFMAARLYVSAQVSGQFMMKLWVLTFGGVIELAECEIRSRALRWRALWSGPKLALAETFVKKSVFFSSSR